jgi:hypothetical protein
MSISCFSIQKRATETLPKYLEEINKFLESKKNIVVINIETIVHNEYWESIRVWYRKINVDNTLLK